MSSACSVPGQRRTLTYLPVSIPETSFDTETAVLKIVSDALPAADHGEVTVLGLPDLSAAFDTVDHTILIDRLCTAFGIRGSVLSWINSFISVRTQTVIFNGTQSTQSVLDCRVPQGSVLGPVLFLLYTADVTNIDQRHGVGAHSYADDIQLYYQSKAVSCSSSKSRWTTCIEEINQWMTSNCLKLNTDKKMQFIWLGTRQQLAKIQCQITTLRETSIHILTEVIATCQDSVPDHHSERNFYQHINGSDSNLPRFSARSPL